MNSTEKNTFFEKVVARSKEILQRNPACHDWEHTQRVLNAARHLAQAEGADAFVVDCAAVMHDIGRPEELADQGKTCHAQYGAVLAADILRELGLRDEAFIAHVAACVRGHRHRLRDADDAPESIEAKVVHDADKLDALGAIGIGRSFHFAGRIGACVHNSDAAALGSESYSSEDSAYREYLVKLRFLHKHLLTASGRRVAASRHEFMTRFFDQLNLEVLGEDFPICGDGDA